MLIIRHLKMLPKYTIPFNLLNNCRLPPLISHSLQALICQVEYRLIIFIRIVRHRYLAGFR